MSEALKPLCHRCTNRPLYHNWPLSTPSGSIGQLWYNGRIGQNAPDWCIFKFWLIGGFFVPFSSVQSVKTGANVKWRYRKKHLPPSGIYTQSPVSPRRVVNLHSCFCLLKMAFSIVSSRNGVKPESPCYIGAPIVHCVKINHYLPWVCLVDKIQWTIAPRCIRGCILKIVLIGVPWV